MSLVICPTTSPSLADKVIPLFSSGDSTTHPHSSIFEDAYYRRIPFGSALTPIVQIAKEAKLLLCRNDSTLHLYSISGVSPLNGNGEPQIWNEDTPEDEATWHNVALLQLKSLTNLISSAISDNGKWIVASDYYECKLFRIVLNAATGVYKPVRIKNFAEILFPVLQGADGGNLPSLSLGASAVSFAPDSQRLVLAMLCRTTAVVIVDLSDENDIRILRAFQSSASGTYLPISDKEIGSSYSRHSSAVIKQMVISADGQWLGCADIERRVQVFNMDGMKHHCSLPSFPYPVSTMSFDPRLPSQLFVGLANNTLQVFDVEKRLFHESQNLAAEARKIRDLHDSIQGLLFMERGEDEMEMPERNLEGSREIISWGSSWICKIAVGKSLARRKRGRDAEDEEKDEDRERVGSVTTRYRNMLGVRLIGDRELVVIEKPVVDVLQKLPPAYFRAGYGRQ